jgi:hypothetical protein
MHQEATDSSPGRHWSALVPLGMSLAALALVLGYAAAVGVQPHQDEGTPARIFQLLLVAQLPIVLYFAVKWVPRQTCKALLILVAQGAAWLAAVGTVLLLERP